MVADQMLKQELMTKLEKLSAEKLQEVLDFASFLLSRQSNKAPTWSPGAREVTPEQDADPLSAFIGAVSHGALAQDIDEELYEV
jgi:hypothetical protein